MNLLPHPPLNLDYLVPVNGGRTFILTQRILYESDEQERNTLAQFEEEEALQGQYTIFVTALDLLKRYKHNINTNNQLAILSEEIEVAESLFQPIEIIIYSRRHILLKIHRTNTSSSKYFIKLPKFIFTNLWKIFLISKRNNNSSGNFRHRRR